MAAALSTFGGKHGPVEATYDLLQSGIEADALVQNYLERGEKIPGWGSSFVDKEKSDPIWEPVDKILLEHFKERHWELTRITQALHNNNKRIAPNPSAYTAISAIIFGMPRHLSPYLLIMGRLPAWAEVFCYELKGT